MPTEEFKDVLDRDFSKAAAAEVISTGEPLLREVVNHATWAFRRCLNEITAEKDVHVAPFSLYHHVIEQVDGVQALVSEACAVATLPLLRAAFEASLQLEYIHADKEQVRQRSLAWFASHLREKVRLYGRLDPETGSGKEFKASWEGEMAEHMRIYDIAEGATLELRTNLESHLQSGPFTLINEELSRNPKRPWYSAFEGPANLRELARALGRLVEYDLQYRRWSSAVHGSDADLYLVGNGKDQGYFRVIRDPQDLARAAWWAVGLLLRTTRTMIDSYRPGEKLQNWYLGDVREAWNRLAEMESRIDYRPAPGV
jgi:hypothetical protein